MRVAITTVAAVVCLLTPNLAAASSTRYDKAVRSLSTHELVARRSTPVHITTFFQHHRWLLAPRHATCWSVPWASSCNRARIAHRAARLELAAIDRRLEALRRARQARLAHDWLYNGFLCIHGGEGSWTANTGNGYHGGLQMDRAFESHWGPDYLARWGDAENWPPWAQIEVGERAYHGLSGFGSWPNTAHACGLR